MIIGIGNYLEAFEDASKWHSSPLSAKDIKEIYDYIKSSCWVSVNDRFPDPLQTVWISNGKGWATLGCLVEDDEGCHWAASNGVIYQDGDRIVSECESDDLDVQFWHAIPKAIIKPE